MTELQAWHTGTMKAKEKVSVRRMVQDTIERLQAASIDHNHLGWKYSRLLQFLWQAAPAQNDSSASMASPEAQHGAFSWLDLEAISSFALRNNSITTEQPLMDLDFNMIDPSDPLNMTLFTDFRWLSDNNGQLIF